MLVSSEPHIVIIACLSFPLPIILFDFSSLKTPVHMWRLLESKRQLGMDEHPPLAVDHPVDEVSRCGLGTVHRKLIENQSFGRLELEPHKLLVVTSGPHDVPEDFLSTIVDD